MQETRFIAGDQKHRSQSGAYNLHLKWREDLGDQPLNLWCPMPSPARSCQKRIGLEDTRPVSTTELTACFRGENLTTFEATKISCVDWYGVRGGNSLFYQHHCVKIKLLLASPMPFWADCFPRYLLISYRQREGVWARAGPSPSMKGNRS